MFKQPNPTTTRKKKGTTRLHLVRPTGLKSFGRTKPKVFKLKTTSVSKLQSGKMFPSRQKKNLTETKV